jgi:outer membrane murein-binding lipoprotein Lpp
MSDKIDLNAPEVQAAIEAAVEAATAPMLSKNKELLGELKKAKKGAEIDPQTVADLEAQVEDLQGKLSQSSKDLKAATTTAEKATKALADEQGFTTKLLADNGLTDQLTKAGVTNPVSLKAAKAMLGTQVQIVTDGDQRVAKVGEKALADFVTEWAKSDEGKYFVAAPGNNGGGAQGGGQGGSAKTMTRTAFDALSTEAKATAMKDGTTLTD